MAGQPRTDPGDSSRHVLHPPRRRARPALAAGRETVTHQGVTSSRAGRWRGTTGHPIRRQCPSPNLLRRRMAVSTAECDATACLRLSPGPRGTLGRPIPSRAPKRPGLGAIQVQALQRVPVSREAPFEGNRTSRRRRMRIVRLLTGMPRLGLSLTRDVWPRQGRYRRTSAMRHCPRSATWLGSHRLLRLRARSRIRDGVARASRAASRRGRPFAGCSGGPGRAGRTQ